MNIPADTDTDADVLPFTGKMRPPPDSELMLVPPPAAPCQHWRTGFVVDKIAGKCLCKRCNAEISPMFVLERLMADESQWRQTRMAYQEEMRRLDERSATKCRHCGKMTRISRR